MPVVGCSIRHLQSCLVPAPARGSSVIGPNLESITTATFLHLLVY